MKLHRKGEDKLWRRLKAKACSLGINYIYYFRVKACSLVWDWIWIRQEVKML